MTKRNAPRPEDFIPLNPTRYHILSSLMSSSKHAYAIIKDIEDTTRGLISLGVPALYENIKRMLDEGLIERDGERTVERGERRKTYRVTGLGQAALAADERARQPVTARNLRGLQQGTITG